MQLAITALGNNSTNFISNILDAISSCNCNIITLRSTSLDQATASSILVNGNWNQIAKLETILDSIQKNLRVHILTLRPEAASKVPESILYTLESVSASNNNIINSISAFLLNKTITIEEIDARYYQSSPPSSQTTIFSVTFTLSISSKLNLRSLRDDLLTFSDNLNIDTFLKPKK